ncbi:hypothetical protein CHELA1G11_12028 [Hyphomicrobiales bacterium]|nr:hypothetical protein CHELA1G11_12028 [Hyphomicrobiales bacterium]CAH1663802.1 hypothetical protein CHELA1G2_12285 [Hyphomicrobiales bacterium]
MLLARPVGLRFFGNVLRGLPSVRVPKRQRKVALSVFATVAERDDMVEVVGIAGHDLPAGDMATALASLPYAQFHPGRDCSIR